MEKVQGYDTNAQLPSFEGGYNALASWYREQVGKQT